jgi:hypothetical protein
MAEIRGTTCLMELGIPHINVIPHRIITRTLRIGAVKVTCTQNSLKSQFLIMISLTSSHLFLSRPQLYHHLKAQS